MAISLSIQPSRCSFQNHTAPQDNLAALLAVVARMLGPTLEDSAVLFVGGLLRTLLRTLPGAIGPVLAQVRFGRCRSLGIHRG